MRSNPLVSTMKYKVEQGIYFLEAVPDSFKCNYFSYNLPVCSSLSVPAPQLILIVSYESIEIVI